MELYTYLIVLLLNTKLYNMFSNVDLTDKRNCQIKGKYMYKLVRELGFLYTSIIFTDLKKIKCPNKKK